MHANLMFAMFVSVFSVSSTASATDFYLLCLGNGTSNDVDSVTTTSKNSDGEEAEATSYVGRSTPFQGEAKIEIVNGVGRIRIPGNLVPTLHGGKDGWFKIKNIKESENEILASAALGFMSSPKVRIDRITGSLSIEGSGGYFWGRCEPYDPVVQKRRF